MCSDFVSNHHTDPTSLVHFNERIFGNGADMRHRSLHVQGIGFLASFGMCGSAVFPFIVGTVADKLGLRVLPIIASIIALVSAKVMALT